MKNTFWAGQPKAYTSKEKAKMIEWGKEHIKVGAVFDTAFETGCVVTEAINPYGTFAANDCEGVECEYNIVMVKCVH